MSLLDYINKIEREMDYNPGAFDSILNPYGIIERFLENYESVINSLDELIKEEYDFNGIKVIIYYPDTKGVSKERKIEPRKKSNESGLEKQIKEENPLKEKLKDKKKFFNDLEQKMLRERGKPNVLYVSQDELPRWYDEETGNTYIAQGQYVPLTHTIYVSEDISLEKQIATRAHEYGHAIMSVHPELAHDIPLQERLADEYSVIVTGIPIPYGRERFYDNKYSTSV